MAPGPGRAPREAVGEAGGQAEAGRAELGAGAHGAHCGATLPPGRQGTQVPALSSFTLTLFCRGVTLPWSQYFRFSLQVCVAGEMGRKYI